MTDVCATEVAYSSGVYAKHPIALVRGEGARLWDLEGREYLDCMAGQGVANPGHAHPIRAAGVAREAQRGGAPPRRGFHGRRVGALPPPRKQPAGPPLPPPLPRFPHFPPNNAAALEQ